ncbi:MAG: 2OG-Fe dioxygenase family protein [Gemmatimonadota bacterium]
MSAIEPILAGLAEPGYRAVPAAEMKELLGREALADWDPYAASWNDLGVDQFMADGGRYRRRRFGAFSVTADAIVRKPHQPHYQGRDYNQLNGGIDRWFDPITDPIAAHPVTHRILTLCRTAFAGASGRQAPNAWDVEMHQFRIEPDATHEGKPTPEGMHRDGVDWVLVALVARHNVAGGVTAIGDQDQRPIGTMELHDPLDAVFLDDRRVWHGVTPLHASRPGEPAYRDALVVTFRAAR